MQEKYPLKQMLALIEEAVRPFPKAAMFQLHEEGYTSIFQQLVSCIISIRTLDETTLPISRALFEAAPDAPAMLRLSKEKIADLLYGSQYPGQKAETILRIAEAAVANAGMIYADYDTLIAIKGVGPKCASLALGVAAGRAAISVDVHVHRVTNRWGIVATKTPEKTMAALAAIIPEEIWIDINRLLMPFGKHICVSKLPWCSTCPVASWCKRVGVTTHR